MIQGFKEFISRGNAVDLAVGMVIGSAFTLIVTSLVDKVINPLIGGLIGGKNFDHVMEFTIGAGENAAVVQPGAVVTAIVNFLLVALALYIFVVTPMNAWAKRSKAEADAAPETPDADVVLLTEIRDLLASNSR
ncbi:MAG: large conductance mechanosensitive channel protein MscL [Actinomycetaceae bacterium]|nr:large conductance mechanosensitive channel protein MscL [Actinomycetaceae bacterium]